MARKYSKKAAAKVGRAMKKRKAGTLRSGRSGRKVKSRTQAIAIGLVADEEFADQCAMRGLSVETALASPLEIIGAWPMGGVTGSA